MLHARSVVGSCRRWRVVLVMLPFVMSCRDHATEPSVTGSRDAAENSALRPVFIVEPTVMRIPTYDGSGEAVHPDVVAFDAPWHGARYWLTMTPYPRSKQTLENPSILESSDGFHVGVPTGLQNPIVKAPKKPKDYNSDPELLYDAANDRLVLFHRLVETKTNTIHVSTSRDGIKWTGIRSPFWERSHNAVSPTVAPRPDAPAMMWYVSAGKNGCEAKSTRVVMRTAADPSGGFVDTKWAGPYTTDLAIPGYNIWHIKARWIPSKAEYWMLISAFPEHGNGCRTDDLFFARSSDGLHWTVYGEPMMRHEDREWTAAAVYRSSFLYDDQTDELSLWLSARGSDGAWHMGYARVRYSSLLTMLEDGRSISPPSATKYSALPQLVGEEP